ncbi:Projectin/twitchin [Pseudoloma neurophilia]|uniref:Projectin/twitchin n=1 Tax=Pseudoloma neurophilia TaxID=146866 RepID=A0A0R0M0S7_9MICR|nr:Projectin/twitchin [Pseudoloma neurophilia]
MTATPVNFGFLMRVLLVKGYMIGSFDSQTVQTLNNDFRPLNMRVRLTHHKNKLILINTNPSTIKNSKIIESLDAFITTKKKLSNEALDLFISLNWIENEKFTDIFFLQNEEYLLEKYDQYFTKCSMCDILMYERSENHKYCQKVFSDHLRNSEIEQ